MCETDQQNSFLWILSLLKTVSAWKTHGQIHFPRRNTFFFLLLIFFSAQFHTLDTFSGKYILTFHKKLQRHCYGWDHLSSQLNKTYNTLSFRCQMVFCHFWVSVLRDITSTPDFKPFTLAVSRAAIKQGIRPLEVLPAKPPETRRWVAMKGSSHERMKDRWVEVRRGERWGLPERPLGGVTTRCKQRRRVWSLERGREAEAGRETPSWSWTTVTLWAFIHRTHSHCCTWSHWECGRELPRIWRRRRRRRRRRDLSPLWRITTGKQFPAVIVFISWINRDIWSLRDVCGWGASVNGWVRTEGRLDKSFQQTILGRYRPESLQVWTWFPREAGEACDDTALRLPCNLCGTCSSAKLLSILRVYDFKARADLP